jgi:hypothetical protein
VDQRRKFFEVVVPGAGWGCACGVPLGAMPGAPDGGATVDGASGGWPVTGAGGSTALGTMVPLVGGAAQGALGAGMMLEMDGMSELFAEQGSGMQALTGVEHTGVEHAGAA